jgi:subtilisin family serine protease
MCDIIAGQLIVCFPKIDPAGRSVINQIVENQISHVSRLESMEEKLAKLGIKPDPQLEFELHLLAVPAGQENWKANFLQYFYKRALLDALVTHSFKDFPTAVSRSDFHFIVAPNYQMTLSGSSQAGPPVSVKDFHFGPYHTSYRQMIGMAASAAPSSKIDVLLLDSGIAADASSAGIKVVSQYNLVDSQQPRVARDDVGHGTAVALLIADLEPKAEFTVVKVADANSRVSEWDALAGMLTKTDPDVVNLSLQFGLPDQKPCNTCGRSRESWASRSAIFENIVEQMQNRTKEPVIVAAAGNSALAELSYPARFGNVLAVGAVTSNRQLSSSSNYGDRDHTGSLHDNHFVLPGGESASRNPEAVITSLGGKNWTGTSMATAFASGVIAHRIGQFQGGARQRQAFLQTLRAGCDKNLKNYSIATHGNGMMRA